MTGGASACDVFWTPTAATTISTAGGTNTSFVGTVIDSAGITVYDGVNWIGRALAFGNTVTIPLADVTITVPTCLRVTKHVVNTGGGTGTASGFIMSVNSGVTVIGTGLGDESGTLYTLSSGTYLISET